MTAPTKPMPDKLAVLLDLIELHCCKFDAFDSIPRADFDALRQAAAEVRGMERDAVAWKCWDKDDKMYLLTDSRKTAEAWMKMPEHAVVVPLFTNPADSVPRADLEAYIRGDISAGKLAELAGVDAHAFKIRTHAHCEEPDSVSREEYERVCLEAQDRHALRADLTSLRAKVGRLARAAHHHPSCPPPADQQTWTCTCGLSDALANLQGGG